MYYTSHIRVDTSLNHLLPYKNKRLEKGNMFITLTGNSNVVFLKEQDTTVRTLLVITYAKRMQRNIRMESTRIRSRTLNVLVL